MVRLKPNTTPIGGFFFVDAAISHDPMQDWDINTLTNSVVSRRKMNPRFNLTTNAGSVQSEILAQNTARMDALLKQPEARAAYLIETAGGGDPPSFTTAHPLPAPGAPPAGIAGRTMRAGVGVQVLFNWFGDGLTPVDAPLAEQRAAVCVKCTMNERGDLLQRLEGLAASAFKKTIELKEQMKLRTSHDADLHTCQGCDCLITTKIWTPIKHILKQDNSEVRSRLDPECWVLSESK